MPRLAELNQYVPVKVLEGELNVSGFKVNLLFFSSLLYMC